MQFPDPLLRVSGYQRRLILEHLYLSGAKKEYFKSDLHFTVKRPASSLYLPD